MDPNDQDNKQSSDQPQVIKPEDMFKPSVSSQQNAPSGGNNQQPAPQPTQSPPPVDNSAQKKKFFLMLGIALGLLVVIAVILVVASSGSNNGGQSAGDESGGANGIIKEPQAIDIEDANNSITSDITGLNDDNDFPPENLSDDNLQL